MSVAKQALGYVEEKLRRVFNLAGPIGLTLNADVTPVIMVDDLRDPGHAFYQGRGFNYSASLTPAVGGPYVCSVQARDDFVTEFFWVNAQLPAGAALVLYLTTPDETVPAAPVAFQTGCWRDRRVSSTDSPPLRTNNSFITPTGTASNVPNTLIAFGSGGAATSVDTHNIPLKVFVPSGGALTWACIGMNGTDAINFGFAGRVWPQ